MIVVKYWYPCCICSTAERFLKLEQEIDSLKVTADGLSLPGRFAVHFYALCCAAYCYWNERIIYFWRFWTLDAVINEHWYILYEITKRVNCHIKFASAVYSTGKENNITTTILRSFYVLINEGRVLLGLCWVQFHIIIVHMTDSLLLPTALAQEVMQFSLCLFVCPSVCYYFNFWVEWP